MKLKISGRGEWDVTDFAEASAVYCRIRKESGEGGSTFRPGTLPGHYISYNGKVWAGKAKDWKAGDVPVYSPYA